MRITSASLVFLLALLVGTNAQAETFRCNGEIIEEGMTQDQVRAECGSPDEIVTQTHHYWVYKRDPDDMDIRVYFYNNGDVEKIDSHRN